MKKLLLFLMAAIFWAPSLLANQAFIYFQDGEEDDFDIMYPSSCVTIWDNTNDELVNVPSDENFMTFTYEGATMLKIYPNDLDYELLVSVDGDSDTYNLDNEDGEWYLTFYPEADNLEVYVRVYLAGQAPSGGGISEVSMNFNIQAATGSGIDNPGANLTIGYFDRTSFQDTTLTITEGYASASVVPGTSFTITPAEGYIVTDITTFLEGIASISSPGEGGTEWYVAVDENPSGDFCSLFVTVDKATEQQPEVPFGMATITQIESLQWMVQWKDYAFISQRDTDYEEIYALLTNAAGETIELYPNLHGAENPNVIFPESGNFFTVNLTGLGLADGTYQLTIPAQYVELGPKRIFNEAQYFDITVGSTPTAVNTPQFTTIVDNWFDISWENVTSLAKGNTTGAYIRNVNTNEEYQMLFLEGDSYSKANLRIYQDYKIRVNLTNNYPDLPNGLYELYIPAGYVKFNGTQRTNEAIEGYMFTYVQAWSDGPVEFNGLTDDNIISLTWPNASAIQYNADYTGDGYGIYGITIWDSYNNQLNLDYPEDFTISGNKLSIDLTDMPLNAGECSVLVPEGCMFVTVAGITDYAMEVRFTFQYGQEIVTPDVPQYNGEATWNFSDGATINPEQIVEVTWGNYELSFNADAEPVSLYSPMQGLVELAYGSEVKLSADKTKILIDLSYLEDDFYTSLNVPEACVFLTIDGTKYFNTATSIYEITLDGNSGVTSVEADGRYRVVNMQGITVLDTDSAADLNSLPRGLYIVNGVKTVR